MHMQRDYEGIRLPKLLGLVVAGATLLAGMVVLPATQASADDLGFAAADDFVAGDLNTTKVPKLTVTKYLSLDNGSAPTGSANDAVQLNSNHDLTPAQGVVFKVMEVVPKAGNSLADIDANSDQTYDVKSGSTVFAGVTNGQGVIDTWYAANSDGSLNIDKTTGKFTGTPVNFPAGANHYYILSEDRDHSPAFSDDNPNKLDKANYKTATNSFFGLPYATNGTDQNKTRGYIYHLHLYPKNVSKQSFAKTVQSVKGSDGIAKTQMTATAGDTVTYVLSQKIYNEPDHKTQDGKLDVSELSTTGSTDIKFADRMSSSLQGKDGTIKAVIRDSSGTELQKLELNTDYTVNLTTKENPSSLNDSSKKMFADAPSKNVTYWVFNFFTASGVSKVQNIKNNSVMQLEVTYDALVTGEGDSTGTGGVVNDAASDFSDNKDSTGNKAPMPSHTNVTNAAVAFGSVQSKNQNPQYGALPDTEYRLVENADSIDKYLGSDGKFYGSNDEVPSGVQIYKATANDKGLVVFAGLPIFGTGPGKATNKTVQSTSWMLVETKTPDGWRNPGIPFGTITFGDVGLTEEQIVQKYGRDATLQPDYTKLNFGKFEAPASGVPGDIQMKFNNQLISRYLAHYKTTDGDSPLALPLTGGRGILLLLAVGALIMGGALYARNRRNNTARA
ncbi:SpaH/EbpB family LPXTG-anchored major pilin [Bifidobacterium sp. ESL0825]|uniref:SpaH/EbpB family LPXTG-anchored major pilin n=1 Tax=Bifidobacterium sp. ESL0825 TaxID=3448587 RepID=UPI0040432124